MVNRSSENDAGSSATSKSLFLTSKSEMLTSKSNFLITGVDLSTTSARGRAKPCTRWFHLAVFTISYEKEGRKRILSGFEPRSSTVIRSIVPQLLRCPPPKKLRQTWAALASSQHTHYVTPPQSGKPRKCPPDTCGMVFEKLILITS